MPLVYDEGARGSPGLQIQFKVDDSFLRPGEKIKFLRYLALHSMHVDVWDSDSLLLIGSGAIELKCMLRQGKPAVQTHHELELLTTDYAGEDATWMSVDSSQCSTPNPVTVNPVAKGRLHMRTGNIGCRADPSRKRSEDVTPPHSFIITPSKSNSGFKGGSLSPRNIFQLNERNTTPLDRLDMDGLQTTPISGNRAAVVAQRDGTVTGGERRKLDCMAAVRQREARKEVQAPRVTVYPQDVQVDRGPYPLQMDEEHIKAEKIRNMLSQAIITHHHLYASLGSAEYMEFVLRNPFNAPQTVTIHSDDPELSVITNSEEWRHFKALFQTPTAVTENLFHTERSGAPNPVVYLRPKESVHIPLKYQTFLCDHTAAVQGPSFRPSSQAPQIAKKNLSNIITAKTIKVLFKAEDGKPMAICQVNVESTPHVVDRTFRLYHPELCFLKKAISLPPWHHHTAGELESRSHISVRCSDPNVICQTTALVHGEPPNVYLKVPGCPSPDIKMFFVMVFTDMWTAAPAEVWQIYVHFLERVDVSCVTGQQTCQSLILRGKEAVRKVKCFPSHPQEVQVDPAGLFVLPRSAVQELHVKVQPWSPGSRFTYVNAVDVEQHRLLAAWLLCLGIHSPVLSKAFELFIPAGGGRGSSKKITYTNPYGSRRTFLLHTDRPDLLQFREDRFQVGGGENYAIGLRFAPTQTTGSAEILVFVNNVEEKTEETFCVKVNYI